MIAAIRAELAGSSLGYRGAAVATGIDVTGNGKGGSVSLAEIYNIAAGVLMTEKKPSVRPYVVPVSSVLWPAYARFPHGFKSVSVSSHKK
jgi:hypothetical protein